MSQLVLRSNHYQSSSVGETIEYKVLVPHDFSPGERLPLVLNLHGAMSSAESLERSLPLFEELTARGEFPRAVVACPSTPTQGGFYMNWQNGPSWETVVAEEFPDHLQRELGPFSCTVLIGASMGGYGVLKMGFSSPEKYRAVAAISPAIFPGETFQDVPEANIQSVLGDLNRAMKQDGADDIYTRNSVTGRARQHAAEIRESDLSILVDCGGEDEFLLHDGASYLHQVLTDLDIDHIFRLVEGAGHIGPEAETRTRDAIRFIGSALIAA